MQLTELDLSNISGKLLSEGERGGILGVGPADLDDVLIFLGLGVQGRVQLLQARDQNLKERF